MDSRSPKLRALARKELPPREKKGKVTPVMGMIPIFIPIFSTVCAINMAKIPAVIKVFSGELSSRTCRMSVQYRAAYMAMRVVDPRKPVSSA
jgi:hypothetical protein